MNKISIKIILKSLSGILCFFLVATTANASTLEELQAKATKLEVEVKQTAAHGQEIDKKIGEIEDKYKEELRRSSEAPQGVDAYDAKIEAAKAQKAQKQKEKKEAIIESTAAEKENTEATTDIREEKTEIKETPAYPLERNPRYTPSKNSKGRRPFIKGENTQPETAIHYASRKSKEKFSFAKEEESVQAYTGTTEENVFIFSDNVANYCQIDTKNLDKMGECLEKMIQNRSGGSQAMKQQMNDLYQESLIDTTSHAIAEASKLKNDSSGYEKNVLIPLQEKSSKATDERGDIEVLTLTEMEALKLKNKILQVFSTQLSLDAFRDFGTYEVNNRDLTNIDTAK